MSSDRPLIEFPFNIGDKVVNVRSHDFAYGHEGRVTALSWNGEKLFAQVLRSDLSGYTDWIECSALERVS